MKIRTQIILAVLAATCIGLGWGWYDLTTKPAKPHIHDGVRKIISKYPSLQSDYDAAMADGVLTTLEAKAIVDRANKLK